MLTIYDWVYGIAEITAVLLSIFAGYIALSIFRHSSKHKYLAAWHPMIYALILFAMLEIFGALKIFGIWGTPWLSHVLASLILVLLIIALNRQINVTKGWTE